MIKYTISTGSFPVYIVDGISGETSRHSPLSKDDLLRRYPKVFRANVGKMEGEYRIRIDTEVNPVPNAPRRVPVELRDKLKQDIIEAIPTVWVSSQGKWKVTNLPGSEGLELPHHRGCHYTPLWGSSLHKIRCSKWILVRCAGREITLPHNISNTIWAVPLEKNAFQNQLRPRRIPTTDA